MSAIPASSPMSGLAAQPGQDRFARVLKVLIVTAGLVHLGFIGLFAWAGVPSLSHLNVASVLIYGLAWRLTQQGRLVWAMWLMVGEVLVHGSLVVACIGWESGFHSYIVLIIPVAIVAPVYEVRLRVAMALALALLYLGLDLACRGATPPLHVDKAVLDVLHHFNTLGTMAILALMASVYSGMVASTEARLHDLACTDALTQLRNRHFAMEVLRHEAAVFARGGRPLSLAICDIDGFKGINDGHGHAAGDKVLQAVAEVLRAGVREIDHVARWGGEEFLLLLPSTDEDEAMRVCERLRAAVHALRSQGSPRMAEVSVTVGVAVLQHHERVDQALQRADRALYEGKQNGKNRVVLAPQA